MENKKNKLITRFENFKSGSRSKVNEADLYDNEGIPSEYLNKVRRENETNARNFRGGNIMAIVREFHALQVGHEDELEELAISTIRDQYGDILDNVVIDAKLVRIGEVKQAIEDASNKEESKDGSEQDSEDDSDQDSEDDSDQDYSTPVDLIDPEVLKNEVDKRKISNAIVQGEAKNVHRIIHLPEVKDRLDNLNPRFVPMIDQLLKSNEAMEWLIPMRVGAGMMSNNPNGMVKVEWEDKPESEKSEKSAQDIIDGIEKMDDINKYEEELEEMFDEGKPKIIVRAVDFAILLHEITKGIFELIVARSIPENEELATRVLAQTDTFEDEFEDLRYGVDMRRDLTSYINDAIEKVTDQNNLTDHKNLKEYVLGNLVDTKYITTKDFLSLTHVIFSIVAGKNVDPVKKAKAERLLKNTILDVCKYLDQKREELEEYYKQLEEWEKNQNIEIKAEQNPEEKKILKSELSEMEKLMKDLESAIDDERYEDAGLIQAQINKLV